MLVRTRRNGRKNQWLLIKHRDEHADPDVDPVAKYRTSVTTGRTMAQIAAGTKPQATSVTAAAKTAVRDVAPWIEVLARVGYAAKAVLYGTIGLLAARGGIRVGRWPGHRYPGRPPGGAPGAVRTPYSAADRCGVGRLRPLAAGRGGDRPRASRRRTPRAWPCAPAVPCAAWPTARSHWRRSGSALAAGTRGRAARTAGRPKCFALPAGEVLVWLAAAGVAGYGLYQLYRAWKAKLGRHLALTRVSAGTASVLVGVCRFGLAARGAVFGLIGFLLGRAAARHDPGRPAACANRCSPWPASDVGRWLPRRSG